MRDPKNTLLELAHHILAQHPELSSALGQLLFKRSGKSFFDANLLLALNETLLETSKSQLRQDLFVLAELGHKENGYFVEFGATDGVTLSNTYLLEKSFQWKGILVEPAKVWHQRLKTNRTAIIDTRCVWKVSGENVAFNETANAEFSTVETHSFNDMHAETRRHGQQYDVLTVSLMDLLEEHNAPREIDYLSIDTEGTELEILEQFDFQKYRVRIITCEHNNTPMKARLEALFQGNGFSKKHEGLSQFDGWWVLQS